ncbi:hypothetical protein UB43_03455 [Pseudomonas sp. 21]|uniref:DUF7210 family protein n=1 Tax=Pseudomonas sp. 21 TaxID=1619948 RepID=UPI0005EBA563|nr:hypothetical protein [Pseudomonas sp. 21]KJK03567.1 hypothetical protein UB43_03455 [Pseudomonas sp. 21]
MPKPSPAAGQPAEEPKLVSVKLNKPHTHNGQEKKVGDTIDVTADQEAWLKRKGVIGAEQEEGK